MPKKTHRFSKVGAINALLANTGRLEILAALAAGPRRVTDLAVGGKKSMSTVSQNLGRLLRGGLVTFVPEGASRTYRLREPVNPIVAATLALLEG